MGKIKISGYKCERCNHIWRGRGDKKPVVCSRCKSPYWDVPRKLKKRKKRKK